MVKQETLADLMDKQGEIGRVIDTLRSMRKHSIADLLEKDWRAVGKRIEATLANTAAAGYRDIRHDGKVYRWSCGDRWLDLISPEDASRIAAVPEAV